MEQGVYGPPCKTWLRSHARPGATPVNYPYLRDPVGLAT